MLSNAYRGGAPVVRNAGGVCSRTARRARTGRSSCCGAGGAALSQSTEAEAVFVQLILTYCLAAEPARCVDHRPFTDGSNEQGLHACVLGAQPEAARWLSA